ncbi:nucleoside 2-deoxyribosyltransferase [Novispirillum sp. DQ9]|uniref:nucleoside 2-deoxyribosyltransferase n=1 Tax=Novispirillum sp. DQ9 TaxID=3398612 RepID=UPI003C7B0631
MTVRVVYLAGPEVFLPDAVAIGAAKKAICARHGLEGLFPLDNALDLAGRAPPEAGRAIFRANVALMRRADAVIANLTPFRGPGCDPGTAFEVGFLHALGKPVFAYANTAQGHAARVVDFFGGAVERRADGRLVDPEGLEVEDFGLVDNLMLDGAALEAGCFLSGPVPWRDRISDLGLFEEAVRRAAHFTDA